MSAPANLLSLAKTSLMIPEAESYADEELSSLIESALALVKSTGVSESHFEANEVKSIVLIYVKTFFGFSNDGSVKELPQSFYFLFKQVTLTKGD